MIIMIMMINENIHNLDLYLMKTIADPHKLLIEALGKCGQFF